jgi:transposase-like protein
MHLRSFTVSEKLRIVREGEEIGNRAAGRKYNVPESCIRDWKREERDSAEKWWNSEDFSWAESEISENRREAS